jgi:hypothetical protein
MSTCMYVYVWVRACTYTYEYVHVRIRMSTCMYVHANFRNNAHYLKRMDYTTAHENRLDTWRNCRALGSLTHERSSLLGDPRTLRISSICQHRHKVSVCAHTRAYPCLITRSQAVTTHVDARQCGFTWASLHASSGKLLDTIHWADLQDGFSTFSWTHASVDILVPGACSPSREKWAGVLSIRRICILCSTCRELSCTCSKSEAPARNTYVHVNT